LISWSSLRGRRVKVDMARLEGGDEGVGLEKAFEDFIV